MAAGLEDRIHAGLGLGDALSVVGCGSGTAALFGLASLHAWLAQRPLVWIVSAFTFRCQRQGPLASSIVVDCRLDGTLDLDLVREHDPDSYDGIIVTPLFGSPGQLSEYAEFCRASGKRLLVDAATCAGADISGWGGEAPADGAAFSLHHTKPMGFGEGGFALVPRQHEPAFRSVINFGRYGGIDTGPWSFNGKLSDPAAAFLADRWRSRASVRRTHVSNYGRILELATTCGLAPLSVMDPERDIPSCVPLLAPSQHASAGPTPVPWMRYYEPLSDAAPVARAIYDRVICLPCHQDVSRVPDRQLLSTLRMLIDP